MAVTAVVAALLLDIGLRSSRKASSCEDHDLRVTTYNVLAPLLCSASHFPKCPPGTTDHTVRLPKVMACVEAEVAQGAVIALQEVDLAWAGKLHAFFAERGYCCVFAQYGKSNNGYMGVILAWPREQYEALDVEISRIADTAPKGTWPKPDPPAVPSLAPFGYLTRSGLKEVLGCPPPETSMHLQADRSGDQFEWNAARERRNEAILVRLRARGQPRQQSFCVATYHMPCLFGSPEKVRVVNIHTYLLLSRLRAFAGGDAAILMGDFNFTPDSSPYALAASGGSFAVAAASNSEELRGLADRLSSKPPWPSGLRSAYSACHNQEPLFTNFAQTSGQKVPFVETLDYIWFTDGPLKVVGCPKLPQTQSEVAGPFPNMQEPSDHLPVTATLRLSEPSSRL